MSYIQLEEFNSCPPSHKVMPYLEGMEVKDYTKEEYWKNKYDTLVVYIRLTDAKKALVGLQNLVKLVGHFRPDEFHHVEDVSSRKKSVVGVYYRLWWD